MRSKRIYIAGPYSKGDVALNVRTAILAADRLAQAGYVPFVPHLTHLWHLLCPHECEFWMKQDEQWLEACDCLLHLPGESVGANRESRYALLQLNIPVYWSVEEAIERQDEVTLT